MHNYTRLNSVSVAMLTEAWLYCRAKNRVRAMTNFILTLELVGNGDTPSEMLFNGIVQAPDYDSATVLCNKFLDLYLSMGFFPLEGRRITSAIDEITEEFV